MATEFLNWAPAVGGRLRDACLGSPSGNKDRRRGCWAFHMAWDRSRNSRSLFLSMKPFTLYVTCRKTAIIWRAHDLVPVLGPPSLIVKYSLFAFHPNSSPITFSLGSGPSLDPPGLPYHLARIVADAEAAEAHGVVILALRVLSDFALIVTMLGEELVQLC